MRPYLEDVSRLAPVYTSCYPNAGLPNAFGGYDEAPETTSGVLGEFADAGLANILGGCCGTGPDHVRAIADRVAGARPAPCRRSRRSGRFPDSAASSRS